MYIVLANYQPFLEKFQKLTRNFIVIESYVEVDSYIKNSSDIDIVLVNPFITLTDNFIDICEEKLLEENNFYVFNCVGFRKQMYRGGILSSTSLQNFIFSVKNRLNYDMKITTKTYSIILPFMYNGDRFPLFKASLESILKLIHNRNNWELCIHEIGEKRQLDSYFFNGYGNINLKYKFSKYDRVFHRAWTLNVAAKTLANNEYLILGDSDLIYTEQWFNEIQKQDKPCAGWGVCYFLSKNATEKYINTKIIDQDIIKTNIPEKACDAGKITFIPKQIFYDISGVPEHFKDTYGGEDNALAAKLEAFGYTFQGINAPIYHLNHEHKTLCDTSITNQAHDMLWKWNKDNWIEENKKPWGITSYSKPSKKNIKILWCKHDRTGIINAHLLDSLQMELTRYFDINFVHNTIPDNMTLGEYNRNVFNNKHICRKTRFEDEFYKDSYDVIITDTPSLFARENFKGLDCLKIGLIEDLQGSKEIYNFLSEQKFDIILNRYKNAVTKVLPELTNFSGKVQWFPHAVDTNFFKYEECNKKYPVVLLGEVIDCIYPKRAKVVQQLQHKEYFMHFPRPKDHSKNPWPTGKEYVKVLNESKIGITCSSIYNYPLMKFMEFPACGSLLCADYFPEIKEMGYKPEENMIELNLTSLEQNLKYWLDRDKDREYIVQNGIELIQKYHSVSYRAKELCNIICQALEIDLKFPEIEVNKYV